VGDLYLRPPTAILVTARAEPLPVVRRVVACGRPGIVDNEGVVREILLADWLE
jgi:hypothetical protein